MNIHKMTIATTAIILTAFTFGAAAEHGNNDKSGQGQYNDKPGTHQSGNPRMQGGNNAARRHDIDRSHDTLQDNENSNRQSGPDSTRGLERAAERRSEHSENTGPRGQADNESRRHDVMPDKDKKVGGGMERNLETTKKKQRWWWPFD